MEDLKDNNLIEQDRIYVENRIENVNFNKFKLISDFKRKLIDYLLERVQNKGDLLSKFK